MSMMRVITTVCMLTICSLIGCADADREMVGSWALTHMTDAQGRDSQCPSNDPDTLIYRFFSNGTATVTILQEGGETHTGRYAIRDRQLVTTDTNGLHSVSIPFTLLNDELILPAEGGGKMFFKKIDSR